MKTKAQLIDEGWIQTDNYYGGCEIWEKGYERLLYESHEQRIVLVFTTKDLKNENKKV